MEDTQGSAQQEKQRAWLAFVQQEIDQDLWQPSQDQYPNNPDYWPVQSLVISQLFRNTTRMNEMLQETRDLLKQIRAAQKDREDLADCRAAKEAWERAGRPTTRLEEALAALRQKMQETPV